MVHQTVVEYFSIKSFCSFELRRVCQSRSRPGAASGFTATSKEGPCRLKNRDEINSFLGLGMREADGAPPDAMLALSSRTLALFLLGGLSGVFGCSF